jgi:hypothetical protein
MKILFFLLLSMQVCAQHYSRLVVYVDKQLTDEYEVDVFFRIGEPLTYIFYDDDVYTYECRIDTTGDAILIITHDFLIVTDESKEIMIMYKEVDGQQIELVYHNE